MKHHAFHLPYSDLLVEPGLVKQGVFELNGVSVASKLHKVTNCTDIQFQLQLRALYHRTAGLRICLHHLHANIASTCLLNSDCQWVTVSSFTLQSTSVPYCSYAAPAFSATAPFSVCHPSQPPGPVAAGTPPDKPYISSTVLSESLADWTER